LIDIVQIGAGIGKDVTCDIIWLQFEYARRKGLSGLFVEPFESSFEKLKEYYSQFGNCFFEQCAIMEPKFVEENDHAILSYWDNCPANNCRATTMPPEKDTFGRNNKKIAVPCMSLADLLDKYKLRGQEFELLQIDAEGKDLELIMTTDCNNYFPKHIRAETVRSTVEKPYATEYLESFGYSIACEEDPYFKLAQKWHTGLSPEGNVGKYNGENVCLELGNYNTLWSKE